MPVFHTATICILIENFSGNVCLTTRHRGRKTKRTTQ